MSDSVENVATPDPDAFMRQVDELAKAHRIECYTVGVALHPAGQEEKTSFVTGVHIDFDKTLSYEQLADMLESCIEGIVEGTNDILETGYSVPEALRALADTLDGVEDEEDEDEGAPRVN